MLDRFTPTAAQFEQTSAPFRIAPGAVQPGLTQFDGVTTYLHGDRLRVFDRVCDHNGGRLISKGGKMVCPLHGWEMDPKTGRYTNVACTKRPLFETDQFDPGQEIVLELPQTRRSLMGFDSPLPVSIRYLNHACLIVEGGGLRFATDPWLIGPAFSNGWWLAEPSPSDAIEAVNACDFLFISHNHPDHLHPETLAQIRRDMPVLTAAFPSRSTERYLRDLG
ncbi:MAG: MBL fold metallo-hydrolase, partial [Pseudomonadota bacterium]